MTVPSVASTLYIIGFGPGGVRGGMYPCIMTHSILSFRFRFYRVQMAVAQREG
jgi:hypothetical protein